MLDGAGHRIGFSAGRLHAGIQAGASPCSDSRNEYKKIQLCVVERFLRRHFAIQKKTAANSSSERNAAVFRICDSFRTPKSYRFALPGLLVLR